MDSIKKRKIIWQSQFLLRNLRCVKSATELWQNLITLLLSTDIKDRNTSATDRKRLRR